MKYCLLCAELLKRAITLMGGLVCFVVASHRLAHVVRRSVTCLPLCFGRRVGRYAVLLLLCISVQAWTQEYQTDNYTKLLLHGNGTDGAISHPITNTENYDSYTKLMLHMDGSDGSTTFTDAATSKTVTANGNVQIDVAQSKFGGASGLFDGSGDYLSLADNDDWSFGSGDFTIDCWVKFNSLTSASSDMVIVGQFEDVNNYWRVAKDNTGNKLFFNFEDDGQPGNYTMTNAWSDCATNTWYHLAFVRTGTTGKIFINGVSQPLTANPEFGTSDVGTLTGLLYVGQRNNTAYFNGWIDELRISKGIARWTSNFTPPTASYGKVTLTTSQSKFGSASARFDGAGSYLSLADRDDWNFGTGDFTIDFWVRFNNLTGAQVFVGQRENNDRSWSVAKEANDKLHIFFEHDGIIVEIYTTDVWSLSANTWYHLAFVRNGATAYVFINGVSQSLAVTAGFGTKNTENYSPSTLNIGQRGFGAEYLNGWLDEARISKGTARWTSNFTPPTSPYTTDSKTALLLHFDGADGDTTTNDAVGGDESGKNRIVTYNGNAQLDTAQRKFGGASGLFDGDADYLTVPDSSDWTFGTGDFTIDFWVKFKVLPTQDPFNPYTLLSQYTAGNDRGAVAIGGDRAFLYYYINNGTVKAEYRTPTIISDTNWHHIAYVRNGSNFYIYVDGVSQSLTVTVAIGNNDLADIASRLYIGAHGEGTYNHNGWLDELRISKGIARSFGSISGVKFNDLNANGIKDLGDSGRANWRIYLKGDKTDSVLTNASGQYQFSSLPSGTYTITEKRQSGWLRTKPSPDSSYTIQLTMGVDTTGFDFGNFQLASISGKKYNDAAGDSVITGDATVNDWVIKLYKSGVLQSRVVTSGSGDYSFSNLTAGTYTVEESLLVGWTQTYPRVSSPGVTMTTFGANAGPRAYSITITSGTVASGKDFGNFQLGSITGTKFNDLNGDGIKQVGEPGLAGWKIKLSGSRTDSVLTDGSGNYSFANLGIGTYTVSEVTQNGWVQTLPTSGGSYNVTISSSGTNATSRDFGNFRLGSINGQKFHDLNGNGVKEGADSGLTSWRIRLGKNGIPFDSALTNTSGNYTFTNLQPGTYTVSELLQTNWTQTYPVSPGTYTIILTSGDSLTGKNFGNYMPLANSITVRKFKDLDGNFSTRDDLIPKQWRLRVYKDSFANLIKDTNASSFTLTNVDPGTYIALEEDSTGWVHIGKLRDGLAMAGSVKTDTFSLALNEAHVIDFVNWHPNNVTIRKLKDTDGNFSTTNDRTLQPWHLTLYKGLISPGNIVGEETSSDILSVSNLGDGIYKAIEADSTGWTHLGTAIDGISLPSGLSILEFIMSGGENRIVDFVNASPNTITIRKFADQDGNFTTTGDRTLKRWSLKLYKDSIGSGVVVASALSDSVLVINNLPIGTYVAVEADSPNWSHISVVVDGVPQGGTAVKQWQVTVTGGQNKVIDFINFDQRRRKTWTASINCEWDNGGNWQPPGIPINGDTIIVPSTAPCQLVIPPCASLGTISIASGETVKVQAGGTFSISGDVDVYGILIADSTDSSTINVCGDWNMFGGFRAGKSIVIFPGVNPQKLKGQGHKFNKLKIGGTPCSPCSSSEPLSSEVSGWTQENILKPIDANVTLEGSITVEGQLNLQSNLDAGDDTIYVTNASPIAVTGSGKLTHGTMVRSIQHGSTGVYQFESNSSYLRFDDVGTYPANVSMTAFPDSFPPNSDQSIVVKRFYDISQGGGTGFHARLSLRFDSSEARDLYRGSIGLLRSTNNGVLWDWVGGTVDSINNTVTVDSVTQFSKWTFGHRPRSVSAEWNIISLPVSVTDPRKTTLFPSATSNAFAYQGAYVQKDTLVNGVGYWLKFPTAQVISIAGVARWSDTIDVIAKWNLIGTLSQSVSPNSVTSIPAGIIVTQFYGFNGSYSIADSLYPLQGYWVKVNQAGKLILNASGLLVKQTQADDSLKGFNRLMIQDAKGKSQTLYFGLGNFAEVGLYELPPPPPAGAFDVRFVSGQMVETMDRNKSNEFPIIISSAAYPVSISWSLKSHNVLASLVVDEREMPMKSNGSTVIHNQKSVIRIRTNDAQNLPEKYSLEQNYPNPFNPKTEIRLQIADYSHVVLKVYDILGREVAILVNEKKEPGEYSVSWDAGDKPTGIYIYRLIATPLSGNQSIVTMVRKMLLIR